MPKSRGSAKTNKHTVEFEAEQSVGEVDTG